MEANTRDDQFLPETSSHFHEGPLIPTLARPPSLERDRLGKCLALPDVALEFLARA